MPTEDPRTQNCLLPATSTHKNPYHFSKQSRVKVIKNNEIPTLIIFLLTDSIQADRRAPSHRCRLSEQLRIGSVPYLRQARPLKVLS